MKIYIACLLMSLCAPLSATVNVKSFGAAGNGYQNDTSALNDAFEVGCATSQSVYIPTGVYIVDPLAVLNGCGTTFYGDGSSHTILRFRSSSSLNPNVVQSLWSFAAGSGKTLTIHSLALQGTNAALAGLSIDHYSKVTITDLNVSNFGTPGYAQGHRSPYDGLYLINSTNATVSNSSFTGNERYGVELQAVHYSTVSHTMLSRNGAMGGVSEENYAGPLDGPLVAQWLSNTLTSNGSGGIDVETASSLPAVQGIIQGNVVTNCGNNNWGSGWGITLGLKAYGVIQGNEVDNFAAALAPNTPYSSAIVYGANGGTIQILSNTVKGTRSYGILGNEGLYPVAITGNTVHANGTGIFIYDSPGVQLSSNTATNNVGAGISVYWSDGSFSGNHYSSNNPDLMINGSQAADQ
jgi:parallel beta-helix repeat protein